MAETIYATQRLDHLGIVAGICREIDLVGQIDRMIGPTDRQVSVGEAVQAMVLNALGFVGRPLYLTPEFFANKPVGRLLRPGLTAEMLIGASPGQAVRDWPHRNLRTGGFSCPASLGHCPPGHHLAQCRGGVCEARGAGGGAHHPRLFARQAPRLKVVALLTSYRSALPLWIQALDGDAADTHTFPQVVEAYIAHLQEGEMPYLVADSALYSEDNLQRLAGVRWLTRAPERIGLARTLIEAVAAADMHPTTQEGYRSLELCTTYGGVRQRWLVIWSQQAEQRESRNR